MTKSQHATNQLITILQLAMGKLNIRGYFTVNDNGVWILHHKGSDYPLAGLCNVTATDDGRIIVSLPGRQIVLDGEATKSPLTATNSQEAH
jgi:hypothetical protein